MGYLAQWGPKGFIVSPEKIVTFDGFSTSIELSDDSQNDTSGKAPTNTKGKKKQAINLSITYLRAAGVDPRGQFDEWESLVGKAYPLYIGGKRFGPENVQLKKVDLSGLRLSNEGIFLTATIAVSFEEYVVPKATSSTGTAKVTSTTETGKKPLVTSGTNSTTAQPLSERQKAAYKQKTDRLLAEKMQAIETIEQNQKELRKPVGGGGGYKRQEVLLPF